MIDVYLDSPDETLITVEESQSYSSYYLHGRSKSPTRTQTTTVHIYKGIPSHQITTENLDEQMHDESIPTWRLKFSRATPRAMSSSTP